MSLIGRNVQKAAELLRRGQLVAIPTETVYGLGANALDNRAVLSIFETKNRPTFDPLIVHADSLESLAPYILNLPWQARSLAEAFWPGPLTLVLPKGPLIADLVTSGLPSVAVRVPNHPLTLELLKVLGFPLAAPSANPFGYISPTTATHVAAQLGKAIPYILDGGECQVGIESTIVSFEGGKPTVLRLGGLPLEAIESVVGEVSTTLHSSSNPQAPGMLKSHYAPRKPLYLGSREQVLAQLAFPDRGGLFFQDSPELDGLSNSLVLSPSGDLREAAHHLFGYLRQLDALPIRSIWAEKLPERDLGRAINDRLFRASVR
ncbi:L-threonylcarbamoyladenylate synthase [Salmonirosea aquatica]|uniref:Threonylcarbamoyl-AMP synthase n=1 Tax=Salmonirosea aquatica TaxID=2654236 RepID=A0A7C9FTH8_9BACT|nr:threonylcarbamoyl-AMP synthase [Cytophagaceae bacterium SJW1-29]